MSNSYQEVLDLNIKAVVSTEAGKAFLWHILSLCDLNANCFSGDNNTTNYIAGKQAVGQDILMLLEAIDPTIYPKLILNNIEESDNDSPD